MAEVSCEGGSGMRFLTLALLSAAFTFNLTADDKEKHKVKSETIDPVTGEKTKVKSKSKAESDGDYKLDEKVETKGVNGKQKTKTKVRADDDGDYKEKVKSTGPEGTYKSKTKVDK
jgi:hypothetical protein